MGHRREAGSSCLAALARRNDKGRRYFHWLIRRAFPKKAKGMGQRSDIACNISRAQITMSTNAAGTKSLLTRFHFERIFNDAIKNYRIACGTGREPGRESSGLGRRAAEFFGMYSGFSVGGMQLWPVYDLTFGEERSAYGHGRSEE